MRLGFAGASLAALLALAPPGPAARAQEPLRVRDVGSLHVGGRVAELSGLPEREIVFSAGAPPLRMNPNGQFVVEQMYAQYVRLAEPRARLPLLLWHGGGLSGVTWETTPDGREGWQMFFLRAGHDVYVTDAVERGRAGWARFPEVFPGEPVFRTLAEGWTLFRMGPAGSWNADPAARRAFEGVRFPVDRWNDFMRQGVPRFTGNDRVTQAAYDALVQRVCPCVVVVHSQGGNFGFNAALNAPDKVRALVAVEPSGAPPASADAARLRDVPHLVVWGDRIDGDGFWEPIRRNIGRWQEQIRVAGGRADTLDLPAEGVRGNTHMLMMDANSDQVAGMVQRWIEARGLMR